MVRDAVADVVAWGRLLIARYAALHDAGLGGARSGALGAEAQRWLDGGAPAAERSARAAAIEAELNAVRAASYPDGWLESPIGARWATLFGAFGAGPRERDLLALVGAFDVSPLIATAVRTLSLWPESNGIERSFAQAVLDPLVTDSAATAELLRPTHPLFAASVLRGLDAPDASRARFLDLSPTVLTWLYEGPAVACQRQRGLTWITPLEDAETQRLEALRPLDAATLGQLGQKLGLQWRMRLVASTPEDIAMAARLLASQLRLSLVIVDARIENDPRRGMLGETESSQRILERARHGAIIAGLERALLLVTGLDGQSEGPEATGAGGGTDGTPDRRAAGSMPIAPLADLFHRLQAPLILADTSASDAPGAAAHLARELGLPVAALPFPEREERERLWERAWATQPGGIPSGLTTQRLGVFPLSPAQIARIAQRRQRDGRHWGASEWDDVCREAVGHRVGDLAQLVKSRATWEQVILPEQVMDVVQEILTFARHRRRVLVEWGLGSRHAYGLGLSCLFSGPPGTGKTLLAGLIARALDLDLFRIDLSRIVSKYIGETEQRLARLFDEARRGGVALLFDEADSLFAKRTEVKSSNDRYANLEVNFLLQRMEDYDGVVILTTNLPDSLDEAFRRRIRFHARFPLPNAEERERLWKSMLPKTAPVADDIAWYAVAQAYEFAGGEIKNAALRAAFYAAEAGTDIDLAHLEKAAEAECRERGRLVLKTARDFL